MFRFHRSIPTISVFYNTSPQSNKVLALLRSSLSSPYPPPSAGDAKPHPPLEFTLSELQHQPPTPDQINTILSYLKLPLSALVSAHPTTGSASRIDSAKALHEAALQNPNVLRYPVVCNWEGGEAAMDVGGVKKMLDNLAKRRDGGDDEDVVQPKGLFW